MVKFVKQDILSVTDCMNNLKHLYIFGDNLLHKGTAGQAIIRSCPNAFGIPTKRLPSMTDDSFFNDTEEELSIVKSYLEALMTLIQTNTFEVIVYPLKGIGTGLAKLEEKSPYIFSLITTFFKELEKLFPNKVNLFKPYNIDEDYIPY